MERVASRLPRSRLPYIFCLRCRVRYIDACVISLFVILVVRPRIAIAHVTCERKGKAAGVVCVAIPRTHSRRCTARLCRTTVQHEYSRAGPQSMRPTPTKSKALPSLCRVGRRCSNLRVGHPLHHPLRRRSRSQPKSPPQRWTTDDELVYHVELALILRRFLFGCRGNLVHVVGSKGDLAQLSHLLAHLADHPQDPKLLPLWLSHALVVLGVSYWGDSYAANDLHSRRRAAHPPLRQQGNSY